MQIYCRCLIHAMHVACSCTMKMHWGYSYSPAGMLYHIYCFANLAGKEEKCLAAASGCGHLILDNIKGLMFVDSGSNTSIGGLKFSKQNILVLYIWYLRIALYMCIAMVLRMCIVHVHRSHLERTSYHEQIYRYLE